MGLMFNCAYLSVGYYFDKRRSLATALASSGTGKIRKREDVRVTQAMTLVLFCRIWYIDISCHRTSCGHL